MSNSKYLDTELDAFYERHQRLCVGFWKMVSDRLRVLAWTEGYINRSFPENMLREVVEGVCEEIYRDLSAQQVKIPEEMYKTLKAWIVKQTFGATKTQWVK